MGQPSQQSNPFRIPMSGQNFQNHGNYVQNYAFPGMGYQGNQQPSPQDQQPYTNPYPAGSPFGPGGQLQWGAFYGGGNQGNGGPPPQSWGSDPGGGTQGGRTNGPGAQTSGYTPGVFDGGKPPAPGGMNPLMNGGSSASIPGIVPGQGFNPWATSVNNSGGDPNAGKYPGDTYDPNKNPNPLMNNNLNIPGVVPGFNPNDPGKYPSGNPLMYKNFGY